MALAKKTFTETGESTHTSLSGKFVASFDFSAGVGTVLLQRSIDNGTTWQTTDTVTESSEYNGEAVSDYLWKLVCSVHTSGSITAFIAQ